MRIITGKYGGRNIIAPASLPVRPTTDFAKTALFNILANRVDFEEISVLDLFCGTGNISFEFASRGAQKITSVDEHHACVKFVKEFGKKLQITNLEVIKADVFHFIDQCREKYDVIFADPPFDWDETDSLPGFIMEKEMLNPGGWLIVEHHSARKLKSAMEPDQVRKYSNCSFSIYNAPPRK